MSNPEHTIQTPPMPAVPRPILSIGAGGIVRDAHYPAYQSADFPVAGIFDIDRNKAEQLAADFHVETIFTSLEEAVDRPTESVLYDVAVPASALHDVLTHIPDGSAVLMQKPMGENLEDARRILDLCLQKNLTTAVNFQLRFAPFVLAAQDLIGQGQIGDLHSLEVRVTVHTPWNLWTFLDQLPRIEILYHSIHYIDLVRHFLDEPSGVYAKTTRHPANPTLAATRTSIIMDYGDAVSANIVTNHGHAHGRKHQESYIRWEGTEGAIRAQMGVLLDYPVGEPDILEISADGEGWSEVPLTGTWFPHAFIGTAASVMRAAEREINEAPTSSNDAYKTMAVVEAAYLSSESGPTTIPD